MVIAYHRKFNFLIVDAASVNVMPTQLGKAAFASSIPPEFSLQIFMDLAEAREHLVLESDLHLLYLLTPHFRDLRKPDWELCLRRFGSLTQAEQDVAKFYNIDAGTLCRFAAGDPSLPAFLTER